MSPYTCRVYERAYQSLRETQPDAKEEAVMLLEAWRAFEAEAESHGEAQRAAAIAAVEKRMPKRVKRKVILTHFCLALGFDKDQYLSEKQGIIYARAQCHMGFHVCILS